MSRKTKKKIQNIITIIVIIFTIYTFVTEFMKESRAQMHPNQIINEKLEGEMVIHYIDVGQGDATFVELPNNETLLIDAGEVSKEKLVIDYISRLGYKKINYVIGTHPHVDHIGGLAGVINHFDIDHVYMPKVSTNTKTFEDLLLTIKNKNLKIEKAFANVYVTSYENFSMYFVAPNSEEYIDLNNYSAVLKIDYKDKSFLFMADAEKISEDEIKSDIKSDVIKIAHHGSAYSSSPGFVTRVKASYVIISVGENNQYNLPSKLILTRWEKSGAKIYRTDKNGNIIVKTDGQNISIKTERE